MHSGLLILPGVRGYENADLAESRPSSPADCADEVMRIYSEGVGLRMGWSNFKNEGEASKAQVGPACSSAHHVRKLIYKFRQPEVHTG